MCLPSASGMSEIACVICVKGIINPLQDRTLAGYVSWVPRLTLLDLRINRTYEHAPGMELVHM